MGIRSTTFGIIGGGSVDKTLPSHIIWKNGANYSARDTVTGTDISTNADPAVVVQAAHDAGGTLIQVLSGFTYTALTMVTLSNAGTVVESRPQTGEAFPTNWVVGAALANGQAAFRTSGFGTAIGAIGVDAAGNADYAVDCRAQGGNIYDLNVKGANAANLYLNGPNGAARCTLWDIRSDNGTNQTAFDVSAIAVQSGTTYRVTTTSAHNYAVNQIVTLAGFASSNGVFQNTDHLTRTITNVSDNTHFDINLGASTTFTTSTGTAQRAPINFMFDGPDHVCWGLRSSGTATAGWSLWMDTSRMQISSGHITGNFDEAGCVFISGAENRLSDFYLDTAACGINGWAHTVIAGNGNHMSALIQNATTAGITNVSNIVLQSGTTYRATSTAHGLKKGDLALLQGFASSNGAFQSTTEGAFTVTNVSDNNHFDVDLGVATTFTDSVGTVTRGHATVTGVAVQSGTVYRFATQSAHDYRVGETVYLEGFVTSVGPSFPLNGLITAVSDSTHFDVDLGTATTFTTSTGTARQFTKYGVLFQKQSSGAYVQGNVLHLNYQGKGANLNTAEFYYAVGFLDENSNDIANFARFAGNRIVGNAANCTRFSNIEATWGSITNADKIFVDVWHYQQDTTTPMLWRTKASGVTAASTSTTFTINHGLAGLPKRVSVTPKVNPGNGTAGTTWWVSSVTATQIVITAANSITNAIWQWEAEM